MRAPYQVLVLIFRRTGQNIEYALLRRADGGGWQGVAEGSEDAEAPLAAARRELWEEAGIADALRAVVVCDDPGGGCSGLLVGAADAHDPGALLRGRGDAGRGAHAVART
jgi:8-oxo-dGTP pyrophosphatase MutT (NUDIX family)